VRLKSINSKNFLKFSSSFKRSNIINENKGNRIKKNALIIDFSETKENSELNKIYNQKIKNKIKILLFIHFKISSFFLLKKKIINEKNKIISGIKGPVINEMGNI